MTKTQILDDEQRELLRRTLCKGWSDDEVKIFTYAIERYRLDPFARQIHGVRRYDSKNKVFKLTVQAGIDGFRLIADRTGTYAGSDDAVFDNETKPMIATVVVYKIVGGLRCPFSASARWKEYCPGGTQGFMWEKMPHVMLSKCGEALALRKAFPAELSGLYSDDEMEQADARDLKPSDTANGKKPAQKPTGPTNIAGWKIPPEQRASAALASAEEAYKAKDLKALKSKLVRLDEIVTDFQPQDVDSLRAMITSWIAELELSKPDDDLQMGQDDNMDMI